MNAKLKVRFFIGQLTVDRVIELKNGLPGNLRKHCPFPESTPVAPGWLGQQRDYGQPGSEAHVPGLGCVLVYTNGAMHFLLPWVLGCTDSS